MKTWKLFFLFYFSALFVFACSLSDPNIPKGFTQTSITHTAEPVKDPESDELSGRPTSEGDNAISRTGPLMPYLINFDTAAFMNCPGSVLNDPVFFSLKFGAYGSGLQLRPELKDVLSKINHVEGRKQQLESSALIKSRAQLSLSRTGYPAQITQTSQGNAVVNTISLNHPSVVNNLATNGVSYRLAHNALVEISLPYPGSSFFNLLPSLNTKYTLYLAYNKGKDFYPISSEKGIHYGRYFHIGFSSDTKFLTQITERDIQTETSGGNWVCPEGLRFAIHRESKFIRSYYENNRAWFDALKLSAEWWCQEDASVLSSWEKKLFSLLMKNQIFYFGKTLKWVKDAEGTNQPVILNKKCIAPTNPKYNSCYNSRFTHKVEFEDSKCVSGDKTKVCPAYLSICVKHSPR